MPAKKLLVVSLTSLALASCQTTGSNVATEPAPPPETLAKATVCEGFKPIYWADGDTLQTAKQVLEHNNVYVRLCGRPK